MRLVVIGGSDAGISAGLRARELAADVDVTLLVADAYPNFSICGLPFYVSGETPRWEMLAHRPISDLQAAGLDLRLGTVATTIDVERHEVSAVAADGARETHAYDRLIVATGAVPAIPAIPASICLGCTCSTPWTMRLPLPRRSGRTCELPSWSGPGTSAWR